MKRRHFFQRIWNTPGGSSGQDPWRRKKGGSGPPDLDQILRTAVKQLKTLFQGTPSGSASAPIQPLDRFVTLALCAVLLLYVLAGIYIVEPPERAVVTRLGRYVRTEGPGPHWLPPFLEARELVNVQQVSTSDHSGLLLTKDGNIVSISVAVQYRIREDEDAVRSYLFNVVNPIRSLSQSADSALRQVIGQSTMDEVLTLKRAEIAMAIKEQMVETLKNYHTGIWVLGVVMQFAKAPDEVRAAFDEVIKASADEERLVNQARAYENEVLPKARGTAERLKSEALADKEESILIAEGNVKRFNLVLPQYLLAPKVTQARLYIETIEEVLSKASKVMVDLPQGNNVVYLPLEPLKTATPMTAHELPQSQGKTP
ncbi:MAG: FtsH protease activity modulator HflK [Gammaproteobacteria bacterium]|nr:FtsH protease activity modulator HflK [Gammaproteobacteria bacterium]MBP9728782.1 FtsH protease activity modulator HflK [Gammaproteobacteria bacterium]